MNSNCNNFNDISNLNILQNYLNLNMLFYNTLQYPYPNEYFKHNSSQNVNIPESTTGSININVQNYMHNNLNLNSFDGLSRDQIRLTILEKKDTQVTFYF